MRSEQLSPISRRVHPLAQLLNSYCGLDPEDFQVIHDCVGDPRAHASGAEVPNAFGFGSAHGRMIISGWGAAGKLLPDGRRQIIRLLLPSDVVGGPGLKDEGLAIVALTELKTVDAAPLHTALQAQPPAYAGLREAWGLAQRAAQRRLVQHAMRLGRYSAYERMADFLVEFYHQQRRTGMLDHAAIFLPTQEVLADLLGLSIVHVNRTLQQMRRDRLLVHQATRVVIPDLTRLMSAAMAEPSLQ